MSIRATSPFPVYLDSDGTPLSQGYVYFGVSGSNPETVPQAVYWDEALTIPAAQPIRTISGFLVRNGSPASVFLSAAYSILVRNRNRVLLYSSLVNIGIPSSTAMVPVVSAATLALARAALGVSKKIKGYQAISLTHFSDALEPSITAGSELEVDGTFYEFAIDEAAVAGGWGAIAVSTAVYMYLVPAGALHTWIYSATAPTWDIAKQGWYNGNNRAFGGLYKDAGGNYTLKWFYEDNQLNSIKRYGDGTLGPLDCASTVTADGGMDPGGSGAMRKWKEITIGDWNMDTTDWVAIPHGLGASWKNIRALRGVIRRDDDAMYYVIGMHGDALLQLVSFTKGPAGSFEAFDATNIYLWRGAGSYFDGVNFDSAGYNRGWITIEYVP